MQDKGVYFINVKRESGGSRAVPESHTNWEEQDSFMFLESHFREFVFKQFLKIKMHLEGRKKIRFLVMFLFILKSLHMIFLFPLSPTYL